MLYLYNMKHQLSLLLAFCLLFGLAACGGEKTENADNSTTDSLATENPVVEEHTPVVVPSVHEFFFSDFIPNSLQLDYEEVPFGQDDYKAFIPTAKEIYVGKYKRKEGTTTSYGAGIKPELTLQTFTFESEAAVEPGLLQWLKSFDGGENLEKLGEGTRALKTSPFLVIADGVDVSVLGTQCEHTGKEWNKMKEAFLKGRDNITNPEKAWVFEVECGGPLIFMQAM